MSEIPHGRWTVALSVNECGLSADAVMRAHPKGDYVQHDDFRSLQERYNALEAELTRALQSRNDECRLRQGAETYSATLQADLAKRDSMPLARRAVRLEAGFRDQDNLITRARSVCREYGMRPKTELNSYMQRMLAIFEEKP